MILAKKNKTLTNLRQEFSEAMKQNDNDNMKRIHKQIEDVQNQENQEEQNKIDEDERLKDFSNQVARDEAIAKVDHFLNVTRKKYEKEVEKVLADAEKAKQKYIDTLRPLNSINTEYNHESTKQYALMNKYELTREDVGCDKLSILANVAPHPRSLNISEKAINERVAPVGYK